MARSYEEILHMMGRGYEAVRPDRAQRSPTIADIYSMPDYITMGSTGARAGDGPVKQQQIDLSAFQPEKVTYETIHGKVPEITLGTFQGPLQTTPYEGATYGPQTESMQLQQAIQHTRDIYFAREIYYAGYDPKSFVDAVESDQPTLGRLGDANVETKWVQKRDGTAVPLIDAATEIASKLKLGNPAELMHKTSPVYDRVARSVALVESRMPASDEMKLAGGGLEQIYESKGVTDKADMDPMSMDESTVVGFGRGVEALGSGLRYMATSKVLGPLNMAIPGVRNWIMPPEDDIQDKRFEAQREEGIIRRQGTENLMHSNAFELGMRAAGDIISPAQAKQMLFADRRTSEEVSETEAAFDMGGMLAGFGLQAASAGKIATKFGAKIERKVRAEAAKGITAGPMKKAARAAFQFGTKPTAKGTGFAGKVRQGVKSAGDLAGDIFIQESLEEFPNLHVISKEIQREEGVGYGEAMGAAAKMMGKDLARQVTNIFNETTTPAEKIMAGGIIVGSVLGVYKGFSDVKSKVELDKVFDALGGEVEMTEQAKVQLAKVIKATADQDPEVKAETLARLLAYGESDANAMELIRALGVVDEVVTLAPNDPKWKELDMADEKTRAGFDGRTRTVYLKKHGKGDVAMTMLEMPHELLHAVEQKIGLSNIRDFFNTEQLSDLRARTEEYYELSRGDAYDQAEAPHILGEKEITRFWLEEWLKMSPKQRKKARQKGQSINVLFSLFEDANADIYADMVLSSEHFNMDAYGQQSRDAADLPLGRRKMGEDGKPVKVEEEKPVQWFHTNQPATPPPLPDGAKRAKVVPGSLVNPTTEEQVERVDQHEADFSAAELDTIQEGLSEDIDAAEQHAEKLRGEGSEFEADLWEATAKDLDATLKAGPDGFLGFRFSKRGDQQPQTGSIDWHGRQIFQQQYDTSNRPAKMPSEFVDQLEQATGRAIAPDRAAKAWAEAHKPKRERGVEPTEMLTSDVNEESGDLQTTKNYRLGAGESKGKIGPENPLTRFESAPIDGRRLTWHFGPKEAEHIMEEMANNLTRKEVRSFKNWYGSLLGMFEERGYTDTHAAAWAAFNIRRSTDSALGLMFKQMDQQNGFNMGGGEPIGWEGSLRLLQGDPYIIRGSAKIPGFIDSVLGRDTRSFVGDDPAGGKPFVADVHTTTDRGHISPVILKMLTDPKKQWMRGKMNGQKIVSAEQFDMVEIKPATKKQPAVMGPTRAIFTLEDGSTVELRVDTKVDGGQPKNYQEIVDWGNRVTEAIIADGRFGKRGWNPAALQAVGWMNILRRRGEPLQTPDFFFKRQTQTAGHELAFGSDSPLGQVYGGHYDALSPDQQAKLTHYVLERASQQVAAAIGGSLRVPKVYLSTGVWQGTSNPNVVFEVVGSSVARDLFTTAMSYIGQQDGTYNTTFDRGNDNHGLFLYHGDGSTLTIEDVEDLHAFFKEKGKGNLLAGATLINTDNGPRHFFGGSLERTTYTKRQLDQVESLVDEWAVSRELDIRADNIKHEATYHEQDWKADPKGGTYAKRLEDSGAAGLVSRLDDLRAEYAGILEDGFKVVGAELSTEGRKGRVDSSFRLSKRGQEARQKIGVATARQRLRTDVRPWDQSRWQNPNHRAWFGKSKAADAKGQPLRLMHGTVRKWEGSTFRHAASNAGQMLWGDAYYFTDSPRDADANYADADGPDIRSHIQVQAQKELTKYRNDFIHKQGKTYPEWDRMIKRLSDQGLLNDFKDQFYEMAREQMGIVGGQVMPVEMSIQNPVIIGDVDTTWFDFKKDGSGLGDKFIKQFADLAEAEFEAGKGDIDAWHQGMIDDLSTEFSNYAKTQEGSMLDGEQIWQMVRQHPIGWELDYAQETLREAFQAMGFDGIIDSKVGKTLGKMEGVDWGTTHYIAFKRQQVKSVFNEGTYGTQNPDMLKSRRGKTVQYDGSSDAPRRYMDALRSSKNFGDEHLKVGGTPTKDTMVLFPDGSMVMRPSLQLVHLDLHYAALEGGWQPQGDIQHRWEGYKHSMAETGGIRLSNDYVLDLFTPPTKTQLSSIMEMDSIQGRDTSFGETVFVADIHDDQAQSVAFYEHLDSHGRPPYELISEMFSLAGKPRHEILAWFDDRPQLADRVDLRRSRRGAAPEGMTHRFFKLAEQGKFPTVWRGIEAQPERPKLNRDGTPAVYPGGPREGQPIMLPAVEYKSAQDQFLESMKKNGISEAELRFTGIVDALEMMDGPISLEQMVDLADTNSKAHPWSVRVFQLVEDATESNTSGSFVVRPGGVDVQGTNYDPAAVYGPEGYPKVSHADQDMSQEWQMAEDFESNVIDDAATKWKGRKIYDILHGEHRAEWKAGDIRENPKVKGWINSDPVKNGEMPFLVDALIEGQLDFTVHADPRNGRLTMSQSAFDALLALRAIAEGHTMSPGQGFPGGIFAPEYKMNADAGGLLNAAYDDGMMVDIPNISQLSTKVIGENSNDGPQHRTWSVMRVILDNARAQPMSHTLNHLPDGTTAWDVIEALQSTNPQHGYSGPVLEKMTNEMWDDIAPLGLVDMMVQDSQAGETHTDFVGTWAKFLDENSIVSSIDPLPYGGIGRQAASDIAAHGVLDPSASPDVEEGTVSDYYLTPQDAGSPKYLHSYGGAYAHRPTGPSAVPGGRVYTERIIEMPSNLVQKGLMGGHDFADIPRAQNHGWIRTEVVGTVESGGKERALLAHEYQDDLQTNAQHGKARNAQFDVIDEFEAAMRELEATTHGDGIMLSEIRQRWADHSTIPDPGQSVRPTPSLEAQIARFDSLIEYPGSRGDLLGKFDQVWTSMQNSGWHPGSIVPWRDVWANIAEFHQLRYRTPDSPLSGEQATRLRVKDQVVDAVHKHIADGGKTGGMLFPSGEMITRTGEEDRSTKAVTRAKVKLETHKGPHGYRTVSTVVPYEFSGHGPSLGSQELTIDLNHPTHTSSWGQTVDSNTGPVKAALEMHKADLLAAGEGEAVSKTYDVSGHWLETTKKQTHVVYDVLIPKVAREIARTYKVDLETRTVELNQQNHKLLYLPLTPEMVQDVMELEGMSPFSRRSRRGGQGKNPRHLSLGERIKKALFGPMSLMKNRPEVEVGRPNEAPLGIQDKLDLGTAPTAPENMSTKVSSPGPGYEADFDEAQADTTRASQVGVDGGTMSLPDTAARYDQPDRERAYRGAEEIYANVEAHQAALESGATEASPEDILSRWLAQNPSIDRPPPISEIIQTLEEKLHAIEMRKQAILREIADEEARMPWYDLRREDTKMGALQAELDAMNALQVKTMDIRYNWSNETGRGLWIHRMSAQSIGSDPALWLQYARSAVPRNLSRDQASRIQAHANSMAELEAKIESESRATFEAANRQVDEALRDRGDREITLDDLEGC